MKIQQIEQSLKAKLLTFNTAKLIRLMVAGLRKRHTEISMSTFGHIQNEVCFGCAATNAILEILGIPADVYISGKNAEDEHEDGSPKIYLALEFFYDELRRGYSLSFYFRPGNEYLEYLNKVVGKEGHFKPIKYPEGLVVPKLTSHFPEEHLQAYEKLADFQ